MDDHHFPIFSPFHSHSWGKSKPHFKKPPSVFALGIWPVVYGDPTFAGPKSSALSSCEASPVNPAQRVSFGLGRGSSELQVGMVWDGDVGLPLGTLQLGLTLW